MVNETMMRMRINTTFYPHALVVAFAMKFVMLGFGQSAKPVQSYPSRLPYSFSNLVWWSDEELRGQLKKRVPGLSDEIAPNAAAEATLRDALKALLKEKGIAAELQSEEPPAYALTAERAPGAPAPSITFRISSPEILIDKVVISQAPDSLASGLNDALRSNEGNEYSAGHDWLVSSNVKEELESKGYLESNVEVGHGTARHEGDHYAVDLLVSVKPGPQYHIATIGADGGPLLSGRDLSSSYTQKPGDIATVNPFGRLSGQLRAFYWQHGYADVDIQSPPEFDREHALVSYRLSVVPGPLYHLRSLSIHGLERELESKARELLGMKPGDVFDLIAISNLSHKLMADSLLKPYGFTFSPVKDRSAAAVDLRLDFYKSNDKAVVTTK
jgi:hypothetical protein